MNKDLIGRYRAERGRWPSELDALEQKDPDYLETWLRMGLAAWSSGPIEPKHRELICLAVAASATSLYESGIRWHAARAIELGSTEAEILEVLQLVSVLGMHAIAAGVPILLEEAESAGLPLPGPSNADLGERRETLKSTFVATRGRWVTLLDALLRFDPDFFEAYLAMAALPWTSGTLPPKVREFIYMAADLNATHLYEPGFRHHLRAAFDHGASVAEVLQVLELVADIGVRTFAVGLPVLEEILGASSQETTATDEGADEQ